MKHLRYTLFILALFLLLGGAAAMLGMPAYAAGGTGPGDALLPIGVLQTVPPHASQWYYFDVGGGRGQIIATLDDNHSGGVRLNIYTPAQIAAWQNGDKLIALGSGGPFIGHDLGWAGNSNHLPGRYYAVVSNDNDAPAAVAVRVTGDRVTTSANITPTATPFPNPLATPIPVGNGITGKLAFTDRAGGGVYVVNGDGSGLHRISTGLDPQWNHGGTQVALARQGPAGGIFTLNADGSNENRVYPSVDARAPDWSPDNATLLFSFHYRDLPGKQFCFRKRCFTFGGDTFWHVASASAAGGSYLDVRASNHAFTPSWNPNGVSFIYNDPSIGIMQGTFNSNVDAVPVIGDLRQGAADYNPLTLMSPQYSPDGKSIVYMVFQQPAWQIAVANADGSNQRLLTRLDPLDFVHPNSFAPVWSPDSQQILFLSDRGDRVQFYLINADGTGLRQVLKNVSDQIPLFYQYQSQRMMSWTK